MIAILQLLLTIVAVFGLWRFWRLLDGRGAASHIIAAGFLIRAFGAQILFWISWLRIPVGRSLQLGDGIWFFGLDGAGYLDSARRLLREGVKAILAIDATYASHLYLQCFTLFAGAFGAVASTAILFNCAAYLATCALILRIGRNATARARLFALAAISFGPATILWSLQPLKDTFFTLLMAAAIALFAEWQKRSSLLCAAAICVVVYEIAGTRWYVAGIIAGASLVFLALVANLPRPRLAASVVAAVLFVMLGLAFLIGGADDVPLMVRSALDPRLLFKPKAEAAMVKTYFVTTRRGFETTKGATSIAPGTALQKQPVVSVVAQSPSPPPASPPPPPPPPPGLATKLASGAAAMFVPRAIAQPFGLVRIGGGRGFWLFADADTLVFDFVILFAFGYCVQSLVRRQLRITPLFILVVLVFAAIAGPMIYSVTNFGTMFRLRGMVFVLAALLPLTPSQPSS